MSKTKIHLDAVSGFFLPQQKTVKAQCGRRVKTQHVVVPSHRTGTPTTVAIGRANCKDCLKSLAHRSIGLIREAKHLQRVSACVDEQTRLYATINLLHSYEVAAAKRLAELNEAELASSDPGDIFEAAMRRSGFGTFGSA